MNKKFHSIMSFGFTVLVLSLLFLSGPAAAVTVGLTAPNDAGLGGDVSFTITVDINDPDTYLPVKYTNLVFSGPDGFSKICKVNMDGTSDCSDVTVTIDNTLGSGTGTGYGYDSAIGYGYDFGNNFGYGYSGAYGAITYTVTWTTGSGLVVGDYSVSADVHVEGSISHDFSSSEQTFSVGVSSSDGLITGESDNDDNYRAYPDNLVEEEVVEEEVVVEEEEVVVEEVKSEESNTGNKVTGDVVGNEVTGAVVGGVSSNVKKGVIAVTAVGAVVAISYLGLIGKFFSLFK